MALAIFASMAICVCNVQAGAGSKLLRALPKIPKAGSYHRVEDIQRVVGADFVSKFKKRGGVVTDLGDGFLRLGSNRIVYAVDRPHSVARRFGVMPMQGLNYLDESSQTYLLQVMDLYSNRSGLSMRRRMALEAIDSHGTRVVVGRDLDDNFWGGGSFPFSANMISLSGKHGPKTLFHEADHLVNASMDILDNSRTGARYGFQSTEESSVRFLSEMSANLTETDSFSKAFRLTKQRYGTVVGRVPGLRARDKVQNALEIYYQSLR